MRDSFPRYYLFNQAEYNREGEGGGGLDSSDFAILHFRIARGPAGFRIEMHLTNIRPANRIVGAGD